MSDKTADRSTLRHLDGEITRALHARKERERLATLAAPPAAQAVVAKRLTLAEEMRSQVSVVIAKQRERERRPRAAAPASKETIGPTRERIAKAGDAGIEKLAPPIRDNSTGPSTRAHRVALPLDNPRYRAVLSGSSEEIARDIVHVFLMAMSGPRVTGSYDGVPSGAGGARPGGVQDFVRESHATAEAIAKELGPSVVRDITWHLTGQVVKPDGSAMRLADSGRLMSPWTANDEKDTAVGWGGLVRSLEVLARWMAQRRASGWRLPTIDAGADQTVALVRLIAGRADARVERQHQVYASRVLTRFLARQRRLQWQREPTAEEMQQFKAGLQARIQVRRERAEKERRRDERRQFKGAA